VLRALIIPILYYVLINTGVCLFFRKKFGETIPFTTIISALVMYISQYVFHTFNVGIYILISLTVILILFVILRGVVAEKKISIEQTGCQIKELSFTPGLVALLVIFIIVTIYDYHRPLTDLDEFWHWGMMVKESLRLDRFYAVEASRQIIHKDYPPFLCMIEVLWCKLSGKFSEGIATTGLHVFIMSMIVCPIIEVLTDKESACNNGKLNAIKSLMTTAVQSILLIAFVASITCAFDNAHIGNTLLADIPMAYIFAYLLLLVVTEKVYEDSFAKVSFVAAAVAMVMTKQVGVALLMVVIFFYILYGGLAKKLSITGSLTAIASVLISAAFYISWNVFVKHQNISDIRGSDGGGQFDISKIDMGAYLQAVAGKGDSLKTETFRNLIRTLFSRNVADVGLVSISFVSALFLLFIIIYIIKRFYKEQFSKEKAISLGISFLVGHVGYAFMLSVMFLFCFTQDEMEELRGYARYIDGYLIGEILAVAIVFLICAYRKKRGINKNVYFLILVMTMMVLLNGTNMQYMIPQSIRDGNLYEEEADYIRSKTEVDTSVKVIYDPQGGWYGYVQSHLQYYLNDRDILWGTDFFTANFNDDAVRDAIICEIRESDDYIYFMAVNENLSDNLGTYTQDGTLHVGMYKVVTEDSTFRLLEIE